MWYDVLCAVVLLFFTIRGAVRGVIWQIAGIAGITLCFIFGNGISAAAGPYIRLDPPLNHWVALLAAYLGFSFLCFGLGRALTGWMEKNQLKEFNRHLGGLFGLIKGLALCLVMTFLLVTMSEDMRERLRTSHSARYAAVIMDVLHPIVPEKLHEGLANYIHKLDADNLNLRNIGKEGGEVTPPSNSPQSNDTIFGQPGQLPRTPTTSTSSPSLLSTLGGVLTDEARRVISGSIQSTSDPQTRAKIEEDVTRLWNSVPPQDRAALQQQIVNVGSNQLQSWLSGIQKPAAPVSTPTVTPNSGNPVPAPIPYSTVFPTQTAPQQPVTQTPASPPISTAPTAPQRQATLLREVAGRISSIPNVRQGIELQIQQQLDGLPESLTLAVLEDWSADVWSRQPDPDPQTTSQSSLEQRILRQLQLQGMTLDRLPFALQQRLRAAQAPQPGSSL